jgi:GT2 family glycosyltransferase
MNKTLVGIVTFGNTEFTKLAVKSIRETVTYPVDIFLVVGQPGDSETLNWLFSEEDIKFIVHTENMGFPYSCNDIYDFAWKENNYDEVIFMGNDVVVYPNALDILIKQARTTDYEWIGASQFDVKTLVRMYPETKKWFHSDVLKFNAFDSGEPWKVHSGWPNDMDFVHDSFPEVHNLCLYKKSVFDKIGYNDVNFYPAYFEDNDYVRRGVNSKCKGCYMVNAVFFHFWSRTIHQGSGGSNSHFFENNRRYYLTKWGGPFAQEKYLIPFNGNDYSLTNDLILPGSLKIDSRKDELKIIAFWNKK